MSENGNSGKAGAGPSQSAGVPVFESGDFFIGTIIVSSKNDKNVLDWFDEEFAAAANAICQRLASSSPLPESISEEYLTEHFGKESLTTAQHFRELSPKGRQFILDKINEKYVPYRQSLTAASSIAPASPPSLSQIVQPAEATLGLDYMQINKPLFATGDSTVNKITIDDVKFHGALEGWTKKEKQDFVDLTNKCIEETMEKLAKQHEQLEYKDGKLLYDGEPLSPTQLIDGKPFEQVYREAFNENAQERGHPIRCVSQEELKEQAEKAQKQDKQQESEAGKDLSGPPHNEVAGNSSIRAEASQFG